MKKLNDMASGTILIVDNDGGLLAGYGVRFVRVVNQDIKPMAEVIAEGKIALISVERLQGVIYDQ